MRLTVRRKLAPPATVPDVNLPAPGVVLKPTKVTFGSLEAGAVFHMPGARLVRLHKTGSASATYMNQDGQLITIAFTPGEFVVPIG